jgi:RNA methyltransferase, TrmH family
MSDLISSASNPIAKRLRALAERKARKREHAFVVEGMQPVWRAAESGWEIDTLILAPHLVESPAVYEMADDLRGRGVRILELSADLFSRLSARDGPAGVMAIMRMQSSALDDASVGASDAWVILHRVHNPGNLGTIIRTADAAGMAGVILCGDSTDPFAPAAVKASMGSLFAVPMVIESEVDQVMEWAKHRKVHLVGTSGYAESAHWDSSWSLPLGIVLGNEGDGLSEDVLHQLDSVVRIPMTGTAESLNLGVAAALLMYEVRRHQIA